MCGRYYIEMEEDTIKFRAMLAELERRRLPMSERVRGGEVFPSQIAPVILEEAGVGVTVRPMRWGFARAGGGGLVLNSRSETADTTPMFRHAAGAQRCLVIASWFYEWQRVDGRKTKDQFAFALAPAGEQMYMAALYERLDGGFEQGGVDCFVILTREADAQVSPYHNRMPVILRDKAIKKAWLNPAVPYATLRNAFDAPPLTVRAVVPDGETGARSAAADETMP